MLKPVHLRLSMEHHKYCEQGDGTYNHIRKCYTSTETSIFSENSVIRSGSETNKESNKFVWTYLRLFLN